MYLAFTASKVEEGMAVCYLLSSVLQGVTVSANLMMVNILGILNLLSGDGVDGSKYREDVCSWIKGNPWGCGRLGFRNHDLRASRWGSAF